MCASELHSEEYISHNALFTSGMKSQISCLARFVVQLEYVHHVVSIAITRGSMVTCCVKSVLRNVILQNLNACSFRHQYHVILLRRKRLTHTKKFLSGCVSRLIMALLCGIIKCSYSSIFLQYKQSEKTSWCLNSIFKFVFIKLSFLNKKKNKTVSLIETVRMAHLSMQSSTRVWLLK